MAKNKAKKDNGSIGADKIKVEVIAIIENIKNKLQENGILVNGCKTVFDGRICRITIRTPKGTRYERFGIAVFDDNEEAAIVKALLVRSFIRKLIELNI